MCDWRVGFGPPTRGSRPSNPKTSTHARATTLSFFPHAITTKHQTIPRDAFLTFCSSQSCVRMPDAPGAAAMTVYYSCTCVSFLGGVPAKLLT